jgi:hypothetical protein
VVLDVCVGYRRSVKQCYEGRRVMSVRSWGIGLKGELYNIGLVFVWRKQQECNLRETIDYICNDIGKQSIVPKYSEKCPLTLLLRISFGIKDHV